MSLDHIARHVATIAQEVCAEFYGRRAQIQQEHIEVPWNMVVQLAKAIVIAAEATGSDPGKYDNMGGESALNDLAAGVLARQAIDDEYSCRFYKTISHVGWLNVWNLTYVELVSRNARAGKQPFGAWPGLKPWLE